jgi:zinc transporter ZupT
MSLTQIDHCRRLIQGSETELSDQSTMIRSWVTEDRKLMMKQRLRNLNLIVDHIIEHMHETNVDASLLRELNAHIDQMEHQISIFHASVCTATQRWSHRSRPLFTPQQGDFLPMSLIIPVTLDCLVDGFMIGVTISLSFTAGIVLAAANCLEMGFLGMAYATRITKCTGSSALTRSIALYFPPLLMCFSSGIGAVLGQAAMDYPMLFVTFVAFGAVVLLSLVCNELLIEAKEAQGEDEKWYIAITIFAGIYAVLMLARAGL